MRIRTALYYALALGSLASVPLATSCAEDGVTTNCPALPLYDVNAAGAPDFDAGGCVTPVGHAVSPTTGGGTGMSGAAGSSGAAGKSGSAGVGGIAGLGGLAGLGALGGLGGTAGTGG
jgi:hypothetical protein